MRKSSTMHQPVSQVFFHVVTSCINELIINNVYVTPNDINIMFLNKNNERMINQINMAPCSDKQIRHKINTGQKMTPWTNKYKNPPSPPS